MFAATRTLMTSEQKAWRFANNPSPAPFLFWLGEKLFGYVNLYLSSSCLIS